VLLKSGLKNGVAFGEKSLIRGIVKYYRITHLTRGNPSNKALLTKGHPYFQARF
jgi:hypothetical protein